MNGATAAKTLATGDLAAAAAMTTAPREVTPGPNEASLQIKESRLNSQMEPLAPLFPAETANTFRSRWNAVQIAFVDDPRQAVREADGLVDEVMRSLTETFASERANIEDQFNEIDDATTEIMRVALRRHRSFFQRLLPI
jgi:hypothetical protein